MPGYYKSVVPEPEKPVFKLIDEFNNTYFKNWKKTELIYYSNAIAGEVGELCNLVKKEYGGGTNNDMTVDKLHEHMLDEIADIYIYLIMISKKLGVGHSQETFDDVIRHKLAIIKDRMEKKSFKTKLLPELEKERTSTKPNSQP